MTLFEWAILTILSWLDELRGRNREFQAKATLFGVIDVSEPADRFLNRIAWLFTIAHLQGI